jgi:hypothetical protein
MLQEFISCKAQFPDVWLEGGHHLLVMTPGEGRRRSAVIVNSSAVGFLCGDEPHLLEVGRSCGVSLCWGGWDTFLICAHRCSGVVRLKMLLVL